MLPSYLGVCSREIRHLEPIGYNLHKNARSADQHDVRRVWSETAERWHIELTCTTNDCVVGIDG